MVDGCLPIPHRSSRTQTTSSLAGWRSWRNVGSHDAFLRPRNPPPGRCAQKRAQPQSCQTCNSLLAGQLRQARTPRMERVGFSARQDCRPPLVQGAGFPVRAGQLQREPAGRQQGVLILIVATPGCAEAPHSSCVPEMEVRCAAGREFPKNPSAGVGLVAQLLAPPRHRCPPWKAHGLPHGLLELAQVRHLRAIFNFFRAVGWRWRGRQWGSVFAMAM